jgi:hypothetical protein
VIELLNLSIFATKLIKFDMRIIICNQTAFSLMLLFLFGNSHAQEPEMGVAVSKSVIEQLLGEKPNAGYFCFTEDRAHDVRSRDSLYL